MNESNGQSLDFYQLFCRMYRLAKWRKENSYPLWWRSLEGGGDYLLMVWPVLLYMFFMGEMSSPMKVFLFPLTLIGTVFMTGLTFWLKWRVTRGSPVLHLKMEDLDECLPEGVELDWHEKLGVYAAVYGMVGDDVAAAQVASKNSSVGGAWVREQVRARSLPDRFLGIATT